MQKAFLKLILSGKNFESEEDGMMEAILSLPAKYTDVVYLYYYEGYKTHEIAKILHCSPSTVRNRLSRARKYYRVPA